MKRLLGKVADNKDLDNQKRVQAHIIGLTEGLPDKNLPWAFPLDDQCIVPAKDDDVWVYVDQMSPTEDHDYNRLWYRRFTEKTYKEAFELDKSDSYIARTDDQLDEEPPGKSSVTYPENKVVKYGDITVEYDKTNDEFRITTVSGSYLIIGAQGNILKSMKDSYEGIKGNKILEIADDFDEIVGGNKIVEVTDDFDEDIGGKKTVKTSDGLEVKTGGTLEPFALGNKLTMYLKSLITWTKTHIHTDPLSGSTGPPSVPPPSVTNFKSSKNKVD